MRLQIKRIKSFSSGIFPAYRKCLLILRRTSMPGAEEVLSRKRDELNISMENVYCLPVPEYHITIRLHSKTSSYSSDGMKSSTIVLSQSQSVVKLPIWYNFSCPHDISY